jgi:hypothetical protein
LVMIDPGESQLQSLLKPLPLPQVVLLELQGRV